MAEVIIKDTNPLHELKDLVLGQTDAVDAALKRFEERGELLNKDQADLKQSLETQKVVLDNVNKRMDELDKQLPKGSKGYLPANGESAKDEGRRKVGEMLVDLTRKARGVEEKYGFWSSQTRTQKEGNVYTGGTPDSGGGYLVPPEQASEIIRLVSNFGLARKLCRIMPMTREVMRLPVATYGPTTIVGSNITASGANKAVSAESSAVGQSTQAFTRPELVATRLMAIDTISIEVDEDSDPSLMNFLVDVFAEAVALAEDFQVLAADNTPFVGVIVGTGSKGVYTLPSGSTSFKNISYKDLIQVYNTCDEKIQDNGAWVMSNYAWNQIQSAMVDSNGRPFNLSDTGSSVGDAAPRRLLGRPVYTSTMMPKAANDGTGTKFLIYGDFKYAIFGDRKRMSIDVSPHAGFTTGDLVMRVMERFAFTATNLADGSNTGAWSIAKTA